MPRKPYNYKQETTLGTTTTLDVNSVMIGGDSPNTPDDLAGGTIVCPYTPFIPLFYLLRTDLVHNYDPAYNLGSWFKGIPVTEWRSKWKEKYISDFFSDRHISDRALAIRRGMERIENWLYLDRPVKLKDVIYGVPITRARDESINRFSQGLTTQFLQRSYKAVLMPYTLMIGDVLGVVKPYLLSVVLPENYLYVKYHILVHNTIPLDKVMVFVAKELDDTQFLYPAARKYYKELLPTILKSSCQVWKVPFSFIKDNCFLPSLSINTGSVSEIRNKRTAVLDELYEYLQSEANIFSQQQRGQAAATMRSSGDSIVVGTTRGQVGTTMISYASDTTTYTSISVVGEQRQEPEINVPVVQTEEYQ